MVLEEFLDILNTDPDYKEEFAECVRSGIHGKDFGSARLVESKLNNTFKNILKETRKNGNLGDESNKLWRRLKDFLEGELRKIDVIANSDPEPHSYRVLEDGPNRYAVDISIKGRYYDEVFIHIYSPLIGPTGVYVITSQKDGKEVIWYGIDVEEFTKDLKDCFFKVWKLY